MHVENGPLSEPFPPRGGRHWSHLLVTCIFPSFQWPARWSKRFTSPEKTTGPILRNAAVGASTGNATICTDALRDGNAAVRGWGAGASEMVGVKDG